MVKLVVAGNYHQYVNWCEENKVKPIGIEARYISSWEDMRGFRDAEIIYYGTYYERKDIHRIKEEARWLNPSPGGDR